MDDFDFGGSWGDFGGGFDGGYDFPTWNDFPAYTPPEMPIYDYSPFGGDNYGGMYDDYGNPLGGSTSTYGGGAGGNYGGMYDDFGNPLGGQGDGYAGMYDDYGNPLGGGEQQQPTTYETTAPGGDANAPDNRDVGGGFNPGQAGSGSQGGGSRSMGGVQVAQNGPGLPRLPGQAPNQTGGPGQTQPGTQGQTPAAGGGFLDKLFGGGGSSDSSGSGLLSGLGGLALAGGAGYLLSNLLSSKGSSSSQAAPAQAATINQGNLQYNQLASPGTNPGYAMGQPVAPQPAMPSNLGRLISPANIQTLQPGNFMPMSPVAPANPGMGMPMQGAVASPSQSMLGAGPG